MKSLSTTVLCLCFSILLHAQTLLPLEAVSEAGVASLRHTVAAKENWYSIGRIYNLPPRTIAESNQSTIEKGLEIGQVLKIPLMPSNFTQSDAKPAAGEVFVPVHHTVREKEGLYRIGQDHNKLPVERLKSLNGLTGDAIALGTRLVVGHLRVRRDQSPLAEMQAVQPAPVVTKDVPKIQTTVNEQPKKQDPVLTKEAVTPSRPQAAEPVREKSVVAERERQTEATETRREVQGTPPSNSSSDTPGGFFNAMFNEQMKGAVSQTINGTMAGFKSSIGKEERKYYALMSGMMPNTVIRVTNPVNGKYVYAKVLNELPTMRENDGLLLRIGSPALAELGLSEGRHEVRVAWSIVK